MHTHFLVCVKNLSTTGIENIKKSQSKGEKASFSAHPLSHVELAHFSQQDFSP